jgi:hypothetical protein
MQVQIRTVPLVERCVCKLHARANQRLGVERYDTGQTEIVQTALPMNSGKPKRMDVNVPSATDRHTRVNKIRVIAVVLPELSLKVRVRRDTFDRVGEFNRSGVPLWFQGSMVAA